MTAYVHPQVNGLPQKSVALIAQINRRHFAGLVADWSHARQTLQGLPHLPHIGQSLERDEFTQHLSTKSMQGEALGATSCLFCF
jgi:hypothetical protein